jgi:hypothetical protein
MAAKVLNTVLIAIGAVVVLLLAFIAVYVIGYSFVAIFGHGGFGSGATRGVGAGVAALIAVVVLALYLRSRRAVVAETPRQHTRGKHAA